LGECSNEVKGPVAAGIDVARAENSKDHKKKEGDDLSTSESKCWQGENTVNKKESDKKKKPTQTDRIKKKKTVANIWRGKRAWSVVALGGD